MVEISGADIPATETQQPTQPVVVNQVESNERTIDESFKLADGEMNNAAFNRRYHVVVGSFGIHDNAKRLQSTLKSEGNDAIIVVNDRGMYRVLIASYDDYSQARVHIDQISNRSLTLGYLGKNNLINYLTTLQKQSRFILNKCQLFILD